jgi:deoxyribonuclease-4
MLSIGSHVSISRGYREAAVTAASLGATAFQYFPKNPRSLAPKRFDRPDAERCAEYCREHGLMSIGHSPYPTNLAAEEDGQRKRTVESLLNDLDIADACGSVGIVVHFGIYKGSDALQGYKNIISTLDDILSRWDGRAKLLIENQAGDHAPMGTTFEELFQIRSLCNYPDKIGFCLDTCHLFASGVWDGGISEEWLAKVRDTGALNHLAAVHLNESKYGSGLRKDRHAPIGMGEIGDKAIAWLLTLAEFRNVPLVLETPEQPGFSHADQIRQLFEWGKRK